MEELLLEGERLDDTGFGAIKLIQNPSEFCYGVDAVILADFAAKNRKKAQTSIDLGTGSGVIPLIMSHKTKIEKLFGLELQEKQAERAQRSVKLNNLCERIEILNGDVCRVKELFDAASFDLVTANPPYMSGGCGLKNDLDAKSMARHEVSAKLEDFMKAAAYLLKDKGDFYMIHRPSRLVGIFETGRKLKLEAKEMRMVSPDENSVANIVLVHFVKGGGAELKLMPQLNVYADSKSRIYSKEILEIYEKCESK